MSSFNKVILFGRLTRDPEIRQIGDGRSVIRFGLATNRKYTRNDNEAV